MDAAKFHEDLPPLVTEAASLAAERCGQCQNLHLLWPMLRIARINSGVEGGSAAFFQAIEGHCASGPKRILIAGAADTGILCLAANASAKHGASFMVIDVCDTPLELCRRFARRFDLPLETRLVGAEAMLFEKEFDIIIAHSLLQFIPPHQRANVYARFAAALKPGGVVIQIFNAGARIEGAIAQEHRLTYPESAMEQFTARGITLPEPREKLMVRLKEYALDRERREGAVASPKEVDDLMIAAGFSIVETRELDLNVAAPFGKFLSKLSKRRYLSIARVNAR
jgi:SAM-dependent methyltransferase